MPHGGYHGYSASFVKKAKDKAKKTRDLQMGGSKYLRGGGIAQRGLGRAFMKGGRVR